MEAPSIFLHVPCSFSPVGEKQAGVIIAAFCNRNVSCIWLPFSLWFPGRFFTTPPLFLLSSGSDRGTEGLRNQVAYLRGSPLGTLSQVFLLVAYIIRSALCAEGITVKVIVWVSGWWCQGNYIQGMCDLKDLVSAPGDLETGLLPIPLQSHILKWGGTTFQTGTKVNDWGRWGQCVPLGL